MGEVELRRGPSSGSRRWYQFSVRSVLVLPLVVTVVMGVLCVTFRSRFAQARAVSAIRGRWAQVSYRMHGTEPGWRAPLRAILGDAFFDDVVYVRAAPGVGAPLEELTALPSIEQLELEGAYVAGAGFEGLGALRKLRILSLNGTDVTDADLRCVGALTQLEWLDLSSTQITDSGLARLTGLRRLRLLNLTGTPTSENGIAILRLALPECSISAGLHKRVEQPVTTEAKETRGRCPGPATFDNRTGGGADPEQ
jgi:hypothetical protein